MKHFRFLMILSLLLFLSVNCSAVTDSIRVLLIGDSTTKGFLPAMVHPERLQLKDMIQVWFNTQSVNKKIKVYNSSKGGETASSLFLRYKNDILPFQKENIDYIIVRYGINDWYKCKDIDKNFPDDLKHLYQQLQKDFPNSKLIAQTITPFLNDKESERMNSHISKVASSMNIPVNDIYSIFREEMKKNGETNYWVRMADVDDIPIKYREWLKPYIYMTGGGDNKKEMILVDDNSLDPFFRNTNIIKNFVNHHPNSAGYAIISRETASYLYKTICLKKK